MDHQVLTKRGINMPFKFEKLEVWDLSLEYVDEVYSLSSNLPGDENFNLKSQIRRASTSISLNIAEGSTGQTNPEQNRFLSYALRSLIETIACLHLMKRRDYIPNDQLKAAYLKGEHLARKLQAFRKSLQTTRSVREDDEAYTTQPFPFND
jgi:four helix bundle protein